ncbi:RagB/SusD family nutrient uptake outer membrane protein [Mucilaginibacter mali]|uniref:RagB/SusD family nutrient uptake outer membrane protein n=1 Tax=Mucilaginibacter mali TaxID=2740462 RepID=A0A7D4Q2D2_9SPHI|nr:RagB/SusD family nutrient uptake outer membrane protein [Mucilaginibacter mali]QKJ29567.1 RagB/SusD family nutrient uptake outer membrane protein [Mucilaginibacter mali]
MTTNQIIKYTSGILLAAGIIAAIPSCKKSLEIDPVSTFGPDYVFSNTGNAEKALISAYACLGGDAGYGIRLSMYYPLDNDEMMGQGATPYPDNERRDIAHYNVQPSNTQLPNPYAQLYAGVERSNLAIYYIPKMDMYNNGSASDKALLKRFYGEALALRAQFYFELIRNWGDVPAQFNPSAFEDNLFKPKTNRDSTYDHILADLAMAETLVPWRTEATQYTNERLSQGAIRALRARIALFRGGYALRSDATMKRDEANYKKYYQIARDECSAIMARSDHRLNASYQSVWKDYICQHKQEPNGEILWEVGMSGGNSSLGDSKLGYYNGPRYNGTGNGALTVLPTYFYSFDRNDTRRDVMCAPYDISPGPVLVARTLQSMVDGKFRRDWTTQLTSAAQYFGTNWPIVRYSDVLLMFAEADNEINGSPTAAAITAFETVRKRAFGAAAIGTTPTDKAGFFTAIVNERSWELGGEGIRKYDLLRWNMLKTKLDEAKARMTAMYQRLRYNNETTPVDYSTLPTTIYYKPSLPAPLTFYTTTSFYDATVTPAPAGYTAVSWVGTGINTTILTYFAVAFTPGKSELMPFPQNQIDVNPNLVQNPGY